jgi:hypothetical protein
MTATLRLTREKDGAAFELRRGTFQVYLDGQDVRSINYGETAEAPVEPGPHTLRIRKGRYSSPDRSFDAGDEEVVTFRCHGALLWPRWAVSFVLPDLAISLKRE